MMPLPAGGIVRSASGKVRARVLIVDDEPLVRWSLATALGVAGFEPVTASCGAEALALARTPPAPAVVLIDLGLYDTDAFVLVDRIRAVAPACRMLALTTSGSEVAADPAWPAVTLIRKPFDLGDVVRLVEREIG
jgi:DNA-binding NtrC family response regulator